MLAKVKEKAEAVAINHHPSEASSVMEFDYSSESPVAAIVAPALRAPHSSTPLLCSVMAIIRRKPPRKPVAHRQPPLSRAPGNLGSASEYEGLASTPASRASSMSGAGATSAAASSVFSDATGNGSDASPRRGRGHAAGDGAPRIAARAERDKRREQRRDRSRRDRDRDRGRDRNKDGSGPRRSRSRERRRERHRRRSGGDSSDDERDRRAADFAGSARSSASKSSTRRHHQPRGDGDGDGDSKHHESRKHGGSSSNAALGLAMSGSKRSLRSTRSKRDRATESRSQRSGVAVTPPGMLSDPGGKSGGESGGDEPARSRRQSPGAQTPPRYPRGPSIGLDGGSNRSQSSAGSGHSRPAETRAAHGVHVEPVTTRLVTNPTRSAWSSTKQAGSAGSVDPRQQLGTGKLLIGGLAAALLGAALAVLAVYLLQDSKVDVGGGGTDLPPLGMNARQAGDPCSLSADCAPDLACIQATCGERPLRSSGESCQRTSECAERLGCIGGTCTEVECTTSAHCTGDCQRCSAFHCRFCGSGPLGCSCDA